MSGLASRIDDVIAARRLLLPRITTEIDTWREVDGAIVALQDALTELREHPSTPPDLVGHLGQIRIAGLRPDITTVLEALQRVQARVSRDTVNIGVSGNARVGKSSLLQSISGLDDAQLPTGSGIPVTAVRSRIYHVDGEQRAILELHTFATFRSAYLEPRHSALGMADVPTSIESFRTWRYPAPGDDSFTDATYPTLLNDLREAQEALPSYVELLAREGRPLELVGAELAGLRGYVAYPTVREKAKGLPDRRYLAVRDIRIECPFPHEDVGSIGVCDLPGIGEITAGPDRQYVAGLQHEVDVVLLVKRAAEGMAYWGERDARALTLLDEARGAVSRRKDFVFVLLNIGGTTDTLAESLRDDVRRKLNEGTAGLHYSVLEADALSGPDVSEHVLHVVLGHLADRLPVMDAEILAATKAQADLVREQLVALSSEAKTVLRQVHGLSAGVLEDVYSRAAELRKGLAVALHELLGVLRDRVGGQDPEYVDAVDEVYQNALAWVRDGLGVGRGPWCVDALRTMIQDRGVGAFATDEFNRVRVELSRKFAALDLFFKVRMDQVWHEVADALGTELKGLLDDQTGAPALAALAELARNSAAPCEVTAEAIEELLALRLDYRTQVYPRVRSELDSLNLQVSAPGSGAATTQVTVATTQDGADELYEIVAELAEQAAFQIRMALLKDAELPGQVLFAAVEQFEDVLIRSGAADREIRQLARSYRDELWPGVYEGLDEADARVARVQRAADALLATTEKLEGGN